MPKLKALSLINKFQAMTSYIGVAETSPIENPSTKEIQSLTEWSVLALVAMLLIRHLLVIDKTNRESNNRMLEKLLEDALEDD